jgi:hypothetical protein
MTLGGSSGGGTCTGHGGRGEDPLQGVRYLINRTSFGFPGLME